MSKNKLSILNPPETLPDIHHSGKPCFDFSALSRSPRFGSAAESIWSGLGLLSLGQYGQAYLLLMQATEVALRAVVDEMKLEGTSKLFKRRPEWIRNAQQNNLDLTDGTLHRLVEDEGFYKLYGFVSGILDLSRFKDQYQRLYQVRNDVVHDGSKAVDEKTYVQYTLNHVLPLLETIYSQALDWDFESITSTTCLRELIVARKYLSTIEKLSVEQCRAALYPFRHTYKLLTDSHHVGHEVNEEWFEDNPVAKEFAEAIGKFHFTWPNDRLYTHCLICFDECIVATEEPEYDDDDKVVSEEVYVVAVGCPNCRLFIPNKYAELANLHYGPLTKERLGSDEWKTLTDC